MAEYRINLLRDDFTKLAVITEFSSLRMVQTVNAVGAFEIVMPATFNKAWLAPDRIIEVYRSAPGVPEYRHFSGLLRKWWWSSDSTGKYSLTLSGTDWMDLLKRRIIAYAKGTSQADKSGQIDNVIKAYVRENLGTGAGSDRSLSTYGFTVQPDTGKGTSVTCEHAYTNLMQALQDIADDATDLDDQVFFWIEHTGKNVLEFRTQIGCQGKNHTTTSSPLYFGETLGNLSVPKVTYDYSSEINYAYVSGRGEGEEQVIEETSEGDWINVSRWNRREGYTSKGDAQSSTELTSAGKSLLAENAPVRSVTGEVNDTSISRLGRDWNIGNKVWYQHETGTFPVVVASMDVQVQDGRETIKAALDTQAGCNHWDDPNVAMLRTINSLRRQVLPVRGQSRSGLVLDFTTDLWDTVEECNKLGLKFSDTNSPFPTQFVANGITYDVAGTWSHMDGKGWRPLCTVTNDGPAIIVPLAQTSEWEAILEIDQSQADVADGNIIILGYADSTTQIQAYSLSTDNSGAAVEYEIEAYTHDGDTTFTNRHNGDPITGANVHTMGLRLKSGTVGFYDNEDLEWHDYQGNPAEGGIGYSAAFIYIQVAKYTGLNLSELYLRSLRITYLSRGG